MTGKLVHPEIKNNAKEKVPIKSYSVDKAMFDSYSFKFGQDSSPKVSILKLLIDYYNRRHTGGANTVKAFIYLVHHVKVRLFIYNPGWQSLQQLQSKRVVYRRR